MIPSPGGHCAHESREEAERQAEHRQSYCSHSNMLASTTKQGMEDISPLPFFVVVIIIIIFG